MDQTPFISTNNSPKAISPSLVSTAISPEFGSIYTPSDYAQFLISWAIRSPDDIVMDLGVGGGSFVFNSFNRLVELGADSLNAQLQIYGSEIDKISYENFIKLCNEKSFSFPNITNDNFFGAIFPEVNAIVGNPPYVRRMYIKSTDSVRDRVVQGNQHVTHSELSRLTDLYVYFLLYALPKLKPGGRLAVITAESWLNVSYGEVLKKYLLKEFDIECLISLDRRVFDDAQVKPVMLLGKKKNATQKNEFIRFFRVKNGLPIKKINNIIEPSELGNNNHKDVIVHEIKQDDINSNHPWGIYFKLPDIYEKLSEHPLLSSISSLALTRVGLQTLAKDFFVLTSSRASAAQIEEQYLRPLAQSSRYLKKPVLLSDTDPDFFVFYCKEKKSALVNTHTLTYILEGESKKVAVRGKQTTVIGYQNKERIQKASRKIWYDLASALEKRGIAEILIPRLIYRDYNVLWNQASFIPGELFIEFIPFPSPEIKTEVYLAILSSSVTEIMLRANAQVYGGGTYNINPGQIKKVPILNAHLLTSDQLEALVFAYRDYIISDNHDRSMINQVVYDILGFSEDMREQVNVAVEELITIATSSKQKHLNTKDIEK